MAIYSIGEMAAAARKERGYSQQMLCEGLCNVSTLHRIEKGQQVPSKWVFDAIMERLGLPTTLYNAYIGSRDMELYQLTRKITGMIAHFDHENMGRAIAELESKIDPNDTAQKLERQYLLFAKACYCHHTRKDIEQERVLLIEAIQITMPNFQEGTWPGKALLTFGELDILNGLALNYHYCGETDKALQTLLALMEYLDRHAIDQEERSKVYPMLAYNIVSMMNLSSEQTQKIAQICDRGIDCCVEYGKLQVLPYLIRRKAGATAKAGDVEQAEKLFRQAVSLFQICKKEEFAEMIQKEIADEYHIYV